MRRDLYMNKEFVTKESNLGEVAWQYPEAAGIMMEYGLHCVGCYASQFDSVEQGSMVHGMDESEMDEMIGRINRVIEKKGDRESARI
jgi:hybrid cluster-associated redox disulfide protein